MGSIIGHRIDQNGVAAHTQQKLSIKLLVHKYCVRHRVATGFDQYGYWSSNMREQNNVHLDHKLIPAVN